MNVTNLEEKYNKCTLCPKLCENRSQVVFGSGNHAADVLLIGEAPGAREDSKGIPFCGMSGGVLDELLAHIGLERNDIFITNTVLCRPPNNRNPSKDEIANCKERLDNLITLMQPKVIVTIGNFATHSILKKTGITTIRGKVFELPTKVKVIPVVHPATYLYSGRNKDKLELMKQDFEAIQKVISTNIGQLSMNDF